MISHDELTTAIIAAAARFEGGFDEPCDLARAGDRRTLAHLLADELEDLVRDREGAPPREPRAGIPGAEVSALLSTISRHLTEGLVARLRRLDPERQRIVLEFLEGDGSPESPK